MIYFTQMSMGTWAALAGTACAAQITEVVEDKEYRIVYARMPGRSPRQPAFTTRTVRGDLTHAQELVQRRGWF